MIVNYDHKTFIEQATDLSLARNIYARKVFSYVDKDTSLLHNSLKRPSKTFLSAFLWKTFVNYVNLRTLSQHKDDSLDIERAFAR